MRKSLGSKRNLMGEDDIKLITETFGDFKAVNVTTLEELGLDKEIEQNLTVAVSQPQLKLKHRKPLRAKFSIVLILAIAG